MKYFIIALMLLQVLLFSLGVHQLLEGNYKNGLFNTAINFVFFFVNIFSLRNLGVL